MVQHLYQHYMHRCFDLATTFHFEEFHVSIKLEPKLRGLPDFDVGDGDLPPNVATNV
jgi:hypothetical protein